MGPKYVQQLWTKLLKSVLKYLETLIAFQRGGIQFLGQLTQLSCVTKKVLQDKQREIVMIEVDFDKLEHFLKASKRALKRESLVPHYSSSRICRVLVTFSRMSPGNY